MDRFALIGAVLFGACFALFAGFRVDALDSFGVRVLIACFLFGVYCALVVFGTAEKKRTLSMLAQTMLGVILACAIAALFGATGEGYAAAVSLGLVLGFTADAWVKHVQLP